MQISLKWINELVDIKTVNLEYLIKKLTLGGFEVEEILETNINNQKIVTLDISATANRPDSLSIQGISIEIAALLNIPYKFSNYSIKNFKWNQEIKDLSLPTLNQANCSTFITVKVENLNNFKAPKWLLEKLTNSKLTIENNLFDFQNYILLETGYPFEFYDLDKIQSKLNNLKFNLSIKSGTKNENFIALNDNNYKIDDSILIIKANDLSIGIAGISSSKDVSYSKNTKSLLIEGSIFNSTKIRQQSRLLGLKTDRSAKYEKSLKNTTLVEALYRLISLLRISNPTLTCKLHTINQTLESKLKFIYLRYRRVHEILGPLKESINNEFSYIKSEIITHYLNRLNFEYEYDSKKLIWKVIIPYLRSEDITNEIDLTEEIGRLHGFNNFLIQLPKVKAIGIKDYSYRTRKKITSCFLNLGFNELIHYSLVKNNDKVYLNNEIKLVNPILIDCSNLRSSLLPSLIETVQENLKQGNLFLNGFEYGHIFSRNILNNFREKECISGIFGDLKTKLKWSSSIIPLEWFEAKGKIEQLFKQLNFVIYWKSYSTLKTNNLFHPYCTGQLFLSNGKNIGIFGQINPILAKTINISVNTYLFEFDFKQIQNQTQINKLPIYHEYSFYPKIIKNISFIIHQNISFNQIKEILYINGSKFLNQINLLDEYKNQSILDKHISICLQLIFQSTKKTLQNKEIEQIMDDLRALLIYNFNAKIRI